MCGIVAVFSEGPVRPNRLKRASAALDRRGPDGGAIWCNDARTAGLAHTRLAINDPENGGQPFFWGPNDRFVAVVNGEFYQLGRATSEKLTGRRGNDCWVLAELFEQYGFPQLLSRLRGEFAFAIYDRHEDCLMLARDRFGVKPLYFWEDGPDMWFASKPSALWAADCPRGWSPEGFWRASATQYPPLSQSLFLDIKTVAPGTWWIASREGRRQGTYWHLPDSGGCGGPGADFAEQFSEAFEESVNLRIPHETSTALALSGGLDSACVAAVAQRALGDQSRELHAFTVDFVKGPHPAYSEGGRARDLGAFLGLASHTVLTLTVEDLLTNLGAAVRAAEGLFVNGHGVAKFALTKAVHQAGHKVLLSGEGADELLFGYRHFLPHFPHSRTSDALEDPAGLGILTSRGGPESLAQIGRELGFIPDIWRSKAALGSRIQSFLSPDFVSSFSGRDPFVETLHEICPTPASPWEVARQLWVATALRAYILEVLGDGCEMAHSVEGRPPFLDHKLWEALVGCPLELLISPPGKGLLRDAFRGRITEEVRQQPKHPFMAPPFGPPLIDALRSRIRDDDHLYVDRERALKHLDEVATLQGADAWEWEPALMWLLSSYELQRAWT